MLIQAIGEPYYLTWLIKLGFRDNDRASVALIEFVDMEGSNDSELVASAEEKNSE